MLTAIAVVLVLSAVASLWSTRGSVRDFENGRPHIDSLRDITGIIDRNELIARFGEPNADLRFQVDLATARANATMFTRYVADDKNDVAAIVLALLALIAQEPWPWILISVAGAVTLANWIGSAWIVLRHHRQFDDEI
jgi:hypothetical protein